MDGVWRCGRVKVWRCGGVEVWERWERCGKAWERYGGVRRCGAVGLNKSSLTPLVLLAFLAFWVPLYSDLTMSIQGLGRGREELERPGAQGRRRAEHFGQLWGSILKVGVEVSGFGV